MNELMVNIDAVKEILNTSSQSAAAAFRAVVDADVAVHVSQVELVDKTVMNHTRCCFLVNAQTMTMRFDGMLNGLSVMTFTDRAVRLLTEKFFGKIEDTVEQALMSEGLVIEVGNIVLNAFMGAIGNAMGIQLEYQVPEMSTFNVVEIINQMETPKLLVAHAELNVVGLDLTQEILVSLSLPSFQALVTMTEQFIPTHTSLALSE